MIWLELTSAWSKCSWICSVRECPRFSSTVQSRYSLCHCPLIVDCNRVVLITTSLPLQQSRKAIPFGMRRRISRNDLLSSSHLCIQFWILAHNVDTDLTDACNIYILNLSICFELQYRTRSRISLYDMIATATQLHSGITTTSFAIQSMVYYSMTPRGKYLSRTRYCYPTRSPWT